MNNILDEIELRLRAASGAASITVADMIYTWLGDKGYTGTLGQRLGAWGQDRNLGISVVSLVATIPHPPTAVLAVPGAGEVEVSFSQAYSGGSEILDYTVVASPGGTTVVGTTTSIVVEGLSNGTAYTFTVRARNSVGYSEYSVPSSTVTPATIPNAPSIFSAVAAPSSAIITITAPVDDGGSPITGYTVTSDPSGIEATGFSPITVEGLTDGVQYTFTAVAHNNIGTSASSTPSSAVISASIPGIPTDVVGVSGDSEVELTWTAPTDGGTAITEYTINTIPAELTQTSATNAHTFTGLANGDSYQFEISATNEVGTSAYSDPSNHVIPSGIPFAPVITGVTRGDQEVQVAYQAADPNGAVISEYEATSSPGGLTASGLDNPLVVTGLVNGTEYTFTLTATNEKGTSVASEPSDEITPATVPDAPTIGTAVAGDAQATVPFTAPVDDGGDAIVSYTATASPGGATATGTTSPLLVTGLANGVVHTFTVTASNSIGTSAASAASNSVTPTQSATVPGAPLIGSATASAGQATVTFTPPANSGGSAITSYTATSTPGSITASGSASPIVVPGLTNGTAYTFKVHATNGSGDGPQSASSNSVTPATVPGAPTIGTATAGNAQASVTFTAPASNGGSAITSYTATSSPSGITASASSSPILVTGLANDVSYTFTITATNAVGTGAASAASNLVTPTVPSGSEGPYDAYYDPSWEPIVGKDDVLTTQAASLPAVSTSLDTAHIDSRYGTRIYRPLSSTSGYFSGQSKLRHYYSRQSCFNADNSCMLIIAGSAYFVIDTTTFEPLLSNRTSSSPDGAVGDNSNSPQGNSDIWWHATNPDLLYFILSGTLTIWQYNIRTRATTSYRSFAGRLAAHGMGAATGVTTGGEGRPSDDGRYICFMVENGSTHLGYITYDIPNDIITGSMVTSVSSNNVTMSSLGNYAILAKSDSSISFADAAASSTLRGCRAYTRDFSSFNQLHSTAGHSDPVIDMDGDEAWVGASTTNFNQLPFGDIFMRKCAGGLPVKLYNKGENNSYGQHMSGCMSDRPGWILLSTYHATESTESGWGDNGIYAVKLSNPPEIRRIAHHRGSPITDYWEEPHATVSRDGLSVLFASKWRTSLGGAHALTVPESFMVGLPSWFYGGSAPTGFNLLANGDFDDTSVWTITNATRYSIGSGVATCVLGDGLGAQLRQSYAFEVGATYRITFDLTLTAGSMNLRLLGGTTVSSSNEISSGSKTIDLVAVTGNDTLALHANNTFEGTIDNVVMVKL